MANDRGGGRTRSARMRIGGMVQMVSNAARWSEQVKRATRGHGLVRCGIYLYNESQKQVPIVTGNLRASGFVVSGMKIHRKGRKFKQKMVERLNAEHPMVMSAAAGMASTKNGVAVGYSAVYGLRVHENPYAGRTHGFSPSGRKYSAGRTKSGRKSTRKTYSTVGKWKFLEDPMKHNQVAFLYILLQEARKAHQGQFKVT